MFVQSNLGRRNTPTASLRSCHATLLLLHRGCLRPGGRCAGAGEERPRPGGDGGQPARRRRRQPSLARRRRCRGFSRDGPIRARRPRCIRIPWRTCSRTSRRTRATRRCSSKTNTSRMCRVLPGSRKSERIQTLKWAISKALPLQIRRSRFKHCSWWSPEFVSVFRSSGFGFSCRRA